MDLAALAVSGVAACALGVAAARLAGPVACTWPSLSSASLVQRIQRLRDRVPSRRRRLAGGAALLLVMAGAGAVAYAANPAAPQRLVTLARQAETGLRSALWVAPETPAPRIAAPQPAPAVNQPEAAAVVSPVPRLVNRPDAWDDATIQHYLDLGRAQGMTTYVNPRMEADPLMRRYGAYSVMLQMSANARRDAVNPGVITSMPFMTDAEREAMLGPVAWNDYLDLRYRWNIDFMIRQAQDFTENPPTGPSTVHAPRGTSLDAAMAAAGVDPRGDWRPESDGQGGMTLTRTTSMAKMAGIASDLAMTGPLPF